MLVGSAETKVPDNRTKIKPMEIEWVVNSEYRVRLFRDVRVATNGEQVLSITFHDEERCFIIPESEIEALLGAIHKAKIPPMATGGMMGLDGKMYELSFKAEDSLNISTFRWWMSSGEGWESLGEIASMIERIANRYWFMYHP
jgi:hypothetical protein